MPDLFFGKYVVVCDGLKKSDSLIDSNLVKSEKRTFLWAKLSFGS